MKLKIFSPDIHLHPKNHTNISLPLYHLFYQDLSYEERLQKLGTWLAEIEMVDTVEACDIVIPATQINVYYEQKKLNNLIAINEQAYKANKLLVCWTSTDFGITPKVLKHFHLHRFGGYQSRKKGNEYLASLFNKEPLQQYNMDIAAHTVKTEKPLIGFCGQAQSDFLRSSKEVLSKLYFLLMNKLGLRLYDAEKIFSTTHVRHQLLNTLERSPLVETKFIKHKKYRAGVVTAEQKELSSKIFYENMRETQYNVCYRGNGNYSIRFYETLCMGRIPIIVMSDNLMPFPELIDWNIFPTVHENEYHNIAEIVSRFHQNLSNEQFIQLQFKAREIFEKHISYNGYLGTLVSIYKKMLH